MIGKVRRNLAGFYYLQNELHRGRVSLHEKGNG